MHSVPKIDIGARRRTEQRGVPCGAAAIAMRSRIKAAVGFRLDNDAAHAVNVHADVNQALGHRFHVVFEERRPVSALEYI